MSTYNAGLALELERSRNRKPVTASLVASSATATVNNPPPITPVKDTAQRAANLKKAQSLQERAAAIAKSARREKVEFTPAAKAGYILLIILNIIGDLLDFGLLVAVVGEAATVIYDAILLPINIYFLGLNPKANKVAGKKQLGGVLIRFLGVENVPILEMFYLRSVYVVRSYRARVKAAEEGIPKE